MIVIPVFSMQADKLGDAEYVQENIYGYLVKVIVELGDGPEFAHLNCHFNLSDDYEAIFSGKIFRRKFVFYPRVPVYGKNETPVTGGDEEMQAPIIHGRIMLKFRNLGAEKIVQKILLVIS